MNTDDAMRNLASTQHGVAAWSQLRAAGVSRSALRHRLQHGTLCFVTPGVLRLAGTPATPEQELIAAVLDAGPTAAASHEAAAWLWELPGFWPGPLDVSRQRRAERGVPRLGELHEPRWLPEHHITFVRGIRVTSVARTLFDLAGVPGARWQRMERAVDNAIARSPAVLLRLHAMLDELAVPGRPGIRIMRAILDERPPGHVPPASGLEARVIALLAEAGITARRQVDLGGEHWIGRVDLKLADAPVVVEADSALHHSSKSDVERDQRRDRALRQLGLVVVRVTDEEAFLRPWLVASRVLTARQRVTLATAGGALAPPA